METASVNRAENFYRVLLILGSIVLALCIFEALAWLEVFDYRSLLNLNTFSAPPDVPDRELLHRRPPNSHFTGTFRGGQITIPFQIPLSERQLYRWDVHYDRNGFRNPSDLNRADLVLIGDSFVEAMTVPDSQTTTSLLAGMKHQTVANLGMWGYGPLEELVVLQRYGLPLRPRTVVWMFSESTDVTDISRYHKQIREMDIKGKGGGAPSSFIRSAISKLRTKIRYASRPSGELRAGLVRTAEGRRIKVYFENPPLRLSRDEISDLDEVTTVIQTAEKLCAAQGVHFLFVFVPSKFRAFHNSCEFPAKSECRNWQLTDLPERLQKAVGPLSPTVGFLDLTPDMMSAVKRGDFPYYSDDGHWSPAGNRVAAEKIGRYLEEMSSQRGLSPFGSGLSYQSRAELH
jgi:hypothetical protein